MSYLKSIIVAMAGCLFPVLCLGASPKLAPDLPTYGPGTLDVIVQFVGQQSETPRNRITGLGGRFRSELGAIRGAAYSLPIAALNALGDDPDIFYISPDREVTATLDNLVRRLGLNSPFNMVRTAQESELQSSTAGFIGSGSLRP